MSGAVLFSLLRAPSLWAQVRQAFSRFDTLILTVRPFGALRQVARPNASATVLVHSDGRLASINDFPGLVHRTWFDSRRYTVNVEQSNEAHLLDGEDYTMSHVKRARR